MRAHTPGRFGKWRINLTQSGLCAAEVIYRRWSGRGPCRNHGNYGWGDRHFCYWHHPDYEAWSKEHSRLTRIAEAAIAKAEA